MGEQVDRDTFHDRVWRLAASDAPRVIHHFRPYDHLAHDSLTRTRTLIARGLNPGTPEWDDALATYTPERAWCASDACQGLWSLTYEDEWGCDRTGGDIILGRRETWLFSDPVSALEFKLRWC